MTIKQLLSSHGTVSCTKSEHITVLIKTTVGIYNATDKMLTTVNSGEGGAKHPFKQKNFNNFGFHVIIVY